MLIDGDQTWILHTFAASGLDFSGVIHCGLKLLFLNKEWVIEHSPVCVQQHSQRQVHLNCFDTGLLQIKLKAYTLV